MTGDPELDGWRQQWQTRDAVPADLRRRVEREIRAARYELVPPIAVTAIVGGGVLVWALTARTSDAYLLAALSWAFIAITWVTSVVLSDRIGYRRAPAGTTATAFLDFTIAVCRGKRAAIAAAAVLYPIFLVVMLVWRYQTLPFAGVWDYLSTPPVLLFLGLTVVLAVVAAVTRRRLGGELDTLRVMRRQFDERGDLPER